MKQVRRERKQHLNSALYYAAMKDVGHWGGCEADSGQRNRCRLRSRQRNRAGGARGELPGPAPPAADGAPQRLPRLRAHRALAIGGSAGGGSRPDHPDAAERGARAERRAKRDGALLRSALPRMQGLRAGLPRRLRQAPLHRLFRVAQRGSLRGAARGERADVLSRFGST